MEKWRYYITDLFTGSVLGTNNQELAEQRALSEDSFVVDAEVGVWLQPDGTATKPEELK